MKKLLFLSLCLLPGAASAQTFQEFVQQRQQELQHYIDQQNQEFISFLKEYWEAYRAQAPIARPSRPEPIKPVQFDPTQPKTQPVEIPVGTVTDLPFPAQPEGTQAPLLPTLSGDIPAITIPDRPVAQRPPVNPPQPTVRPGTVKPGTTQAVTPPPATTQKPPAVTPPVQSAEKPAPVPPPAPTPRPNALRTTGASVAFYGNTAYVNPSFHHCFTLNDVSENSVANAWATLCRKDYKALLHDCQTLREHHALNDWGYVLLAGKVATALCSRPNEQVLMQMFILAQSGYKAKVARSGNRLILLVATDGMLYGQAYFTLNGERYFVLDRGQHGTVYTYNRDFANATRAVSMHITQQQWLQGRPTTTTHRAKGYPGVQVTANVKEELIDFYKDYPQCEFPVYATAPVSEEVQQSILPPLKTAIAGKSEAEAADILLNFVQTGFAYATDDQQFGYEKPFFVDELFYYPACDCEDRSVLYSYLVRSLLGLDVVLLDYPNHIATAVCFNETVTGDYVTVSGRKYIICDPTYINASIGNAMPELRNVQAKVIRF